MSNRIGGTVGRAALWAVLSVLLGAAPALGQLKTAPENLDFESGEAGQPVNGWVVSTPGWQATVIDQSPPQGKFAGRLAAGDGNGQFGNVLQVFDAAAYRGRRVELRAKVRIRGEPPARGQMWLRADRPDGKFGAFDNMQDRPIRASTWTDALIVRNIDTDATSLVIGFMAIGGAALEVDDVSLSILGQSQIQTPTPPRALTERGRMNLEAATRLLAYIRFFCPSDQAVAVKNWDLVAVELLPQIEPAGDASELSQRLREALAMLAPAIEVWAGTPDDAPPLPPRPAGAQGVVRWRHKGVGLPNPAAQFNVYNSQTHRDTWTTPPTDAEHAANFVVKPLAGGVSCRWPLSVYFDDGGTLPHAAATPERYTTDPAEEDLPAGDRKVRLAAVALGWGVLQHFYPYFDVVPTDWDAALAEALTRAAQDQDERAFLATLRRLIHHLHDGHGNVFTSKLRTPTELPVQLDWAGDDLIVMARHSSAPPEIRVGDILLQIDGRPIADCYAEVSQEISAATEGWRRYTARRFLTVALPLPEQPRLALRHPGGDEYAVTVTRVEREHSEARGPARPADGTDVAPGVVYFDMNGAGFDRFQKAHKTLAAARAIIFDLRGYPGDAAPVILQHLTDTALQSAQWQIPLVAQPDRQAWRFDTSGRWELQPLAPRYTEHVAFLTDGRAISYAESIMGIVEHYRLGEIVGATTAGTNGNVNPMRLPGGFQVSWTGMRVLKHDGSQHHGVGIKPTIPVHPTAEGIAAGRDEVLEKAAEVLSARLAGRSG